jgi:magnesium-transporting ATPase (P-type)
VVFDKTGTLTLGEMEVERAFLYGSLLCSVEHRLTMIETPLKLNLSFSDSQQISITRLRRLFTSIYRTTPNQQRLRTSGSPLAKELKGFTKATFCGVEIVGGLEWSQIAKFKKH